MVGQFRRTWSNGLLSYVFVEYMFLVISAAELRFTTIDTVDTVVLLVLGDLTLTYEGLNVL